MSSIPPKFPLHSSALLAPAPQPSAKTAGKTSAGHSLPPKGAPAASEASLISDKLENLSLSGDKTRPVRQASPSQPMAGAFGQQSASHGISLRPNSGSAAPKSQKVIDREARAQEIKKLNKQAVRASRVRGIPDAEHAIVENAKYDAYLLNSAHPRGKEKSKMFAKAGFERVHVYDKNDPTVAEDAANSNPEYLRGRAVLDSQLKDGLSERPAELKPETERAVRFDTKQRVVNSNVPDARPLMTRAQWAFDKKEGTMTTPGHLGSLYPSDTSSEEER